MPPISLTEERSSFWLLSLIILKDWVTEPDVTKTVSYFRVSAVMITRASELVIKDSFLHEKKMIKKDKRKRLKDFIEIKNKAKRAKEKMRLKAV